MSRGKFKIFRMIIVINIFLMISTNIISYADNGLKFNEQNNIEEFVIQQMKLSKIPGVEVVVVKNDKTLYEKGFGFSNIKKGQKVSSDTLFELGSTSKAFTALGIYLLEEKGLIKLSDPVVKFIPWLELKYKDKIVDITIEQFLHQTSGLEFKTIGDIPIGNNESALEDTVRTLVDKELAHAPGEKFTYASINYDVLGLVIQNVSGVSFEEFMIENVFNSIGMSNTYLKRSDKYVLNNISTGYKFNFMVTREYNAPIYRGNTPAGYVISNGRDIAKWLKIQLKEGESDRIVNQAIKKTHRPDYSVKQQHNKFYAGGWFVSNDDYLIFHDGSNPNFSSYVILQTKDKIGIAVMANINTAYTKSIAQGILSIMSSQQPKNIGHDIFFEADKIMTYVFGILTCLILLLLYMVYKIYINYTINKRKIRSRDAKVYVILVVPFLIIIIFGYMLWSIPKFLFGLPWGFIAIWTSSSIIGSVILAFIVMVLFMFYLSLAYMLPLAKSKSKKIK